MTSTIDTDLVERARDEADLCRAETATDVAELLDELASALTAAQARIAELETQRDANFGVIEKQESHIAEVEKERDALRNQVEAEAEVCWSYRAERDAARAQIADLLPERDAMQAALTQLSRERDAARAEANHLRKIGALLEARCLGAERVRDDLTDERDEARAALIQAREHYELRSELYTNDADVAAGMNDILRSALSDHQTEENNG